MDDQKLHELDAAMLQLADGDRAASGPVFSILWPELTAFAERTLGKGADADDAAQLALEKLFAQASDFDASRSTLAWALAVTGWECRTILQRRRRRREESLEEEIGLPSGADAEAMRAERSALVALRESIAELSPEDQETLTQAFFRETDGPAAPAFRKRKERALNRLRSVWRRIYGD